MTRTCGGCTQCCRTMPVVELAKGAEWCRFCKIGSGCNIYDARPRSCVDFVCQWLIGEEYLDDSLRPDRVKVVLTGTPDGILVAHCDADRPVAWREPKIYALLQEGARNRGHSLARAGGRFWIVASYRDWEVEPKDLIRDKAGEVKVVVPYRDGRPVEQRKTV